LRRSQPDFAGDRRDDDLVRLELVIASCRAETGSDSTTIPSRERLPSAEIERLLEARRAAARRVS